MNATTVKLDPALHGKIRRLRAKDQTLTGYVRELVEREERTRKLEQAAAKYDALLAAHPDEAIWLEAWEHAPLDQAPATSRRR